MLRSAAITPVVLVHLMMIESAWPTAAYRAISMNGYYGVTLFFVISGFLITDGAIARYHDLARINFREFYRARALRILPALVLMMGVTFGLWLVGAPGFKATGIQMFESLVFILFLSANYAFIHGFLVSWWAPLWSLAIEGAFYLAYPPLLRMLNTRRLLTAAAITGLIISPLFRWYFGITEYSNPFTHVNCVEAIVLGCVVATQRARFLRNGTPRWLSVFCLLGGLSFFLSALLGDYLVNAFTFGPTKAALGGALLLIWATASDNESKFLTWAAFPGRYCYEIYLLHWPIIALLKGLGAYDAVHENPMFDIAAIATFILIVGVSWAFSQFLCLPIAAHFNRRTSVTHPDVAKRLITP